MATRFVVRNDKMDSTLEGYADTGSIQECTSFTVSGSNEQSAIQHLSSSADYHIYTDEQNITEGSGSVSGIKLPKKVVNG